MWRVGRLSAEENSNISTCRQQPVYRVTQAGYDSSMPPFIQFQTLAIFITLWIASITEINEKRQDFTVDLYFRMSWRDHRISYPVCEDRAFVIIAQKELDRIWMPDIYYGMEKKASRHHVLLRNGGMRLAKRNNWIYFTERLTITNFCAFDFRYFPMDRQLCSMPLESYIHHAVYTNVSFDQPGIYFNNFKFKIPQYTLSDVRGESCNYDYEFDGNSLNQTCVQATFVFDRQFSYYFVQMYLPSILIVLVSFLSFWVPVENVPGRVALGVTSLLTLATQFTTMQRSLPPVSYMKAMDVWMFFCIVVVFLSMVEFTLAYNFKFRVSTTDNIPDVANTSVNVANKDNGISGVSDVQDIGKKMRKINVVSPDPSQDMTPVLDKNNPPVLLYSLRQPKVIVLEQKEGKFFLFRNWLIKCLAWWKKKDGSLVDNVSKALFPICFAIFNFCYWSYYLRIKYGP